MRGLGWRAGGRRLVTSPSAVAVVVWLVTAPLAMLAVRAADLDPIDQRGAFLPVAALVVLIGAGCLLARWWRADEMLSAVAAGLLGAWVALAMQVALTGTPYGYAGLQSDNGRTTAAATKYSVTMWSSDTFIDDLPSEYPPLFPWLVGRASALSDVPAWRLVAPAEILLLSFAVVAGYVMWRRVLSGPTALLCSALVLPVYAVPLKPFAVLVLVVIAPWAIATFTRPRKGGLHWLPAGVVGGLMVLTYHGWLTFGAVGILALILSTWRRTGDRSYLVHVGLVVAVAFVVSSPYVVPLAVALVVQGGGDAVSDLSLTPEITDGGLPFLRPDVVGVLQLVGLVGLLWFRQRLSWSRSLLYLVAGAYVFWAVLGVRFVLTGHTTMFFYAVRLSGYLLAVAGVLVLARTVPVLLRRLDVRAPDRIGVAVVALVLLFAGFTHWQTWRPHEQMATDDASNFALFAHLEPLPDCTLPRHRPEDVPPLGCLPVDGIRAAVEEVRGAGTRPYTLSGDERLFAFLPWRAYVGVDRTSAGTLVRYDDRMAELERLSRIRDPREFERASSDTEFGPIDVFVLGRVEEGQKWAMWDVEFRPDQFDPDAWKVIDRPEWPVAVAVRR
jgi:hypothetical protein